MPLYGIDGNRSLRLIVEQPLRFETDIHSLVEANLEAIFGLKLVAREFTVGTFTLDTVAFNDETRGFMIIEYKRDEGGSVVDQGYAYLGTMLNNKAAFVLKYNEVMGKKLSIDQVDWSQSRILFVTQRFTPYQIAAINFKDLPIELWRFVRFENGTLLLEQVKPAGSAVSIKPLMRGEARVVQREIAVQTSEEFITRIPEPIQQVFREFDSTVRATLPDIELTARKWGLTFKRRWAAVAYVKFQRGEFRLDLRLPKPPIGSSVAESRRVQASDTFKVAARIRKPEEIQPALALVKAAYEETGRVLQKAS